MNDCLQPYITLIVIIIIVVVAVVFVFLCITAEFLLALVGGAGATLAPTVMCTLKIRYCSWATAK